MKTNRPVVAAILAVLAVPFTIAAIQDLGRGPGPVAVSPEPADELEPGDDPRANRAGDPRANRADDPRANRAGDPRANRAGEVEPQEGADRQRADVVASRSFVDRLFVAGSRRPGLHGGLAGARFGMTRDELRAEAGALWRWAEQGISEFRPANLRLEFEAGGGQGLSAVAVRFPDNGGARDVLAAAWGNPVSAEGQDEETRSFWFDEASHTRVLLRHASSPWTLGESEVVVQRIQPLASFYRRARGFAFERRPILGATPAELSATFGGDFEFDPSSPGAGRLLVDPTDYARARTQCTIAFQDGAAVALQIVIDHGWEADFGPIGFAALRAQFGPVRSTRSDADGNRWTFDDRITVQQSADSPQLVVSASRP